MDADTLDLCKENIQPLKQGRRASKLGLALLAQTDIDVQEQLLKEREQHELEIMTYEGPDPLGPRYDYVHWIEQSCPKHGKDVNLIPLLEDTIMAFKEDDRYKQDSRFIELIIKYIETQDNPVELFQMVYAQGVGTKCAAFYKAWADQLDMNNDFQRADQVFQMALSNGAEPKDVVEQAHVRFQMSVGRRMMTGQLAVKDKSVSTETAERQRQVLGKIKKGGTHRPSSGLPGKLPLLPANRPLGGNSASTFEVYQEDENGLPIVGSSKGKLNVNCASARKENTVKPGPWNQGFKRRPGPAVPPTPVHSTPTFKVLMDEEDEETPQRPTIATPVPANVLKSRKAEFKPHAQDLFKSPHPSNKPHLPLFEAFAGGREFSFDELRWAYLSKKSGMSKSSICEETPVKGKHYTPNHLESPATPCRYVDHDSHPDAYKTPATRLIPILESPDPNPSDGPSQPRVEILPSNTPSKCPDSDPPSGVSVSRSYESSSKTPFTLKLHEDGVCAIPDTPLDGRRNVVDRFATPSTSRIRSSDTPSLSNLISRPKISKPVKSAPFTIFTDDD